MLRSSRRFCPASVRFGALAACLTSLRSFKLTCDHESDACAQVSKTRALVTDDVIRRIIENRLKFEKRNAVRSKKDLSYLASKQYVAEI